jgi:hypothetical protein
MLHYNMYITLIDVIIMLMRMYRVSIFEGLAGAVLR